MEYKFNKNGDLENQENNNGPNIQFSFSIFTIYYYDHPSNCKLGSFDNAVTFLRLNKKQILQIMEKCAKSNYLINLPDKNAHRVYNHFNKLGFTIKKVGKIPIGYNEGFQNLFVISISSYRKRIQKYNLEDQKLLKQLDKIKSYKSDKWRNKFIEKLKYEIS